ncbi:Dbl homology (DH) domain and SH3 domain-containing protein [Strongyloides ratti]|uniref:Dbl homology (DH) domain and SH3 domain-containing protein n=1 Tax=Strongyloides ratti TaxID=34506 RepID=A0A090LT73_STRRB|nr:Dbl homology (DH) domain and SH3 domain-containing protein [Strongyloides ratti]CEF70799.1 Dbl homology (DH) domain and SH3 domain-containing protein [Strongyloides ratti]
MNKLFPFYARVTSNTYNTIQFDDIVVAIEQDSTSEFRYRCRNSFNEEAFIESVHLNKIEIDSDIIPCLVLSIADYNSTEQNDLQFTKFTIISIENRIDDFWATGYVIADNGKRMGKDGMFPLTYVVPLINIKLIGNEGNDYAEVPSDETVILRDPKTLESSCKERKKVKSLYDFEKRSSQELTINTGDEIEIEKEIDDDWYYGLNKRTGERGVIPRNYVTKDMEDENEIVYENINDKQSSTPSNDSREYGLAVVLYDYTAQYDDELTVLKGYSLKVIEFCGEEWVKCQNPKTEEIGIVPIAFLQIYSDDGYGLDNIGDGYEIENDIYNQEDFCNDKQTGSLYPTLPETINEEKIDINIGGETFPKKDNSYTPSDTYNDLGNNSLQNFTNYSLLNNKMYDDSTNQFINNPSYVSTRKNIEWVQFPELNKLAKTEDKQTPERPPPPNKLNNLKPVRLAPPRPEKLPNMKIESNPPRDSHMNNNGSILYNVRKTPTSIASIIEELISSEIEYSTFLEMWESTISKANELTTKEKDNLLTGYSQLKLLSKYLVEAFVEEQCKEEKDQKIGYVFIRFKDKFFQAYTSHCGALESIAETIEEESDSGLRQKLSLIVDEMRLSGKNIFDVTSAVTRPIQRAMKYILYLDQLYKMIPPNHPDYKNLFKAKENMTYLSKNLNDTKRKCEITKKYIDDKPLTIMERLSRLNMHSVAKKSSRFKYRISSNLGLNKIKDNEFSKLLIMLKDANSRLLKFLYHLQIYRKVMKDEGKKYVSDYTKNDVRNAINDGLWETYLELTTSILIKITEYVHLVDQEIGQKASALSARDYGRLIKKRNDKLADYENALNSLKPTSEISSKKAEYDALNTKLKSDLPKTIDNIYNSTTQFIHQFLGKHYDFLLSIDKNHCMLQREKSNWKKNPHVPLFSVFIQKNNKIFIFKRIEALPIGDKIDIRFKNQPLNDSNFHTTSDIPVQTESHKNFLLSMCPNSSDKENLRIVTKNFKNPADRFYIKKGNIVLIIERRGQNYFVTNGLSESIVSPDCLSIYPTKENLLPLSSNISANSKCYTNNLIDIPSTSNTKKESKVEEIKRPSKKNELDLLADIFGSSSSSNSTLPNTTISSTKKEINYDIFGGSQNSSIQKPTKNVEINSALKASTFNPSSINVRPRPTSNMSIGQPNKISLPTNITPAVRPQQTTMFQTTQQQPQQHQITNKNPYNLNNTKQMERKRSEDLIDLSENLIDLFAPVETKSTNSNERNLNNLQNQLSNYFQNFGNQQQHQQTLNYPNYNQFNTGTSASLQQQNIFLNEPQLTLPNYNNSSFLDEIRASISASPPTINWDAKPSDTPRIPQRPVMPYTIPRKIM